jgi:hypothetical protein
MWWFRIAIAILVLGEGYLVLSGRLAASNRHMNAPLTPSAPGQPDPEFFYDFLTNVLWIAFLAPIGLTVVWLANRDKSVTAGSAYWRAIKTVFVVAWKGTQDPHFADEAETVIEEDPLGALMKGLAVAAVLPSFFWFGPGPGFMPHTLRTALWLGITGLLVGASVYCLERARPFLTPSWHAAQRGRLFRRWWSPYPISYNPPGNRWIVWHWVFLILAAVTWIGGASVGMEGPN